jgi:hypothetical protein
MLLSLPKIIKGRLKKPFCGGNGQHHLANVKR